MDAAPITNPAPKKKRKAKAIKVLHVFNYDGQPVRCWLDKKEKEICFRRKYSRKVIRIGLREMFEKEIGQKTMPFV